MDGLPALGEVIRQYGLTAKRSLGQNFLLDLNLTSRIARAAGDLSGYSILEIGAGPGGLTRALLMNGAEEVIAVEQDPRFLPALTEISNHYKGKLRLIPGNALETNFEALIKEKPVKIIANLPYNIGTALLIQWLTIEKWPPWYNSMTLMFQKEVAQRIVAQPGNSSYGRLGVLAGWRTEASILFDINRKAFTPAPLVTSSVVHLTPRKNPLETNLKALEKITQAVFSQRRKMLRHSLKKISEENLLEKTGIDGQRRPETLSLEEFVALANAL